MIRRRATKPVLLGECRPTTSRGFHWEASQRSEERRAALMFDGAQVRLLSSSCPGTTGSWPEAVVPVAATTSLSGSPRAPSGHPKRNVAPEVRFAATRIAVVGAWLPPIQAIPLGTNKNCRGIRHLALQLAQDASSGRHRVAHSCGRSATRRTVTVGSWSSPVRVLSYTLKELGPGMIVATPVTGTSNQVLGPSTLMRNFQPPEAS